MAPRITVPIVAAIAVAACNGEHPELTPPTIGYGNPALAITSDALYFARGTTIVRFDRVTEEETSLASFTPDPTGNLRPWGQTALAINGTRLFFTDGVAGGGPSSSVRSVPLDGGETRLESSIASCVVGGCLTATDDTLFHTGYDGTDGYVVSVDLASSAARRVDAPEAISVAIDETTLYAATCYATWSAPLEGGAALRHDHASAGCAFVLARDGDRLYSVFNGRSLASAPLDTLVPEEIATNSGGGLPFVVRDGVIFAAVGGGIMRIDDAGQEELVSAPPDGSSLPIRGIALDGDTLYWIEARDDEPVTVRQLAL